MTIAASSGAAGVGSLVLLFLFAVIGIGLYFMPLIIAYSRHIPNTGSVAVINIFLGWTFIGWIVALAMAARSQRPPAYVVPPGWGPQTGPPPIPPAGPDSQTQLDKPRGYQ